MEVFLELTSKVVKTEYLVGKSVVSERQPLLVTLPKQIVIVNVSIKIVVLPHWRRCDNYWNWFCSL